MMKNSKAKRILGIVFIIGVCIVSMIQMDVLADGGETPTTVSAFTFSNNTITKYNVGIGGKDVVIPDSINGQPVMKIGNDAFYNTYITSVKIPDTVTEIGNNAFNGCSLTAVTLPSALKKIGFRSFYYNKIQSLVIPNQVMTIDDECFQGNGIVTLTLGIRLQSIGYSSFRANKIANLVLPNSLTTIRYQAFEQNNITELVIPDSVINLERSAFATNKITKLAIGSGITTIPQSCFDYNYLQDVTIPNTITTIEQSAFYKNNLVDVMIPASVTNVGTNAFAFQKRSVPVAKIDGHWVVDLAMLSTSMQPANILNLTQGTVDIANKQILLTDKPALGTAIFTYNYRLANGTVDYSNLMETELSTSGYAYQVIFKDDDGTILKTELVNEGSAATAPTVPTVPGKIFAGWDTVFDSVNDEMVIHATYTTSHYEVVFKDFDGIELKKESVPAGSFATAPNVPIKEGYTFTGWDKDFTNITGNLVITAQYKANQYTVTFKDYDGTILKTETVEYSQAANAPVPPFRKEYSFIGWDKTFDCIKNNIVVNAEYKKNGVTVIFKDHDNINIQEETIDYGGSLMAPKAPKRPGYTFIGWDHDLTNITTDLIVNPIFKKYPTANASNIKVPIGTQIDVLKQIEAIDADGNVIHKGITIIRNPVNFNKPGKYTVMYQVEDQWGGMATGSFIVEILEENEKIVDTSDSLSSTLYSVLVFICLVSMLSIKKSEKNI